MMDMEKWGKWISQYGFPVVVSGYLLLRMEGTIKELTIAVQALAASGGV